MSAMDEHKASAKSLDIDNSAQPFRAPKTAELVARELRNRIVRGELREGETLPAESDLMSQFSISRPTLREALRILESESLLTVTRGSREGPRVHLPDPRVAARHFGLVLQSRGTTLEDIYNMRLLIEPSVARVLALNATTQAVETLRTIVDDQRRSISDSVAYSQAGVRFHKALIELTGNRALVLSMAILNHVFERHISTAAISDVAIRADAESKEKTIRTNERLIALIEQGKGEEAGKFWHEHLEAAAKIIRTSYPLKMSIDMLD